MLLYLVSNVCFSIYIIFYLPTRRLLSLVVDSIWSSKSSYWPFRFNNYLWIVNINYHEYNTCTNWKLIHSITRHDCVSYSNFHIFCKSNHTCNLMIRWCKIWSIMPHSVHKMWCMNINIFTKISNALLGSSKCTFWYLWPSFQLSQMECEQFMKLWSQQ